MQCMLFNSVGMDLCSDCFGDLSVIQIDTYSVPTRPGKDILTGLPNMPLHSRLSRLFR